MSVSVRDCVFETRLRNLSESPCRSLSFVRNAFSGTPTFVKEVFTKEDQRYGLETSDILCVLFLAALRVPSLLIQERDPRNDSLHRATQFRLRNLRPSRPTCSVLFDTTTALWQTPARIICVATPTRGGEYCRRSPFFGASASENPPPPPPFFFFFFIIFPFFFFFVYFFFFLHYM